MTNMCVNLVQTLLDTKEGKPPRYKLFYRGDGTVTWIRTTTEVR